MRKYGLNIDYFIAPRGGPRYMAPILVDAADDAEAERQAHAIAAFAIDAMVAHEVKVIITTEPDRQVVNTILRRSDDTAIKQPTQ